MRVSDLMGRVIHGIPDEAELCDILLSGVLPRPPRELRVRLVEDGVNDLTLSLLSIFTGGGKIELLVATDVTGSGDYTCARLLVRHDNPSIADVDKVWPSVNDTRGV